ncbi:hypothetical protein ARAM_002035 [Aspergillus rambellii]|uniref:DUF1740-domain-containing protein n=1 Tax=Aspergillus rambellii TaxID=308745 RepID=A0A0F8V1Y7_9EURO|nr:hypothetical protein ARAM_002035 [Aspergillus rambellii]
MDSSGSQEKKAVPRFASFKPQPPTKLPSRERSERDERPRHHSKHQSRHRSHRDGRSRSRERRRDRKEPHSRKEASRRGLEHEQTPISRSAVREPSEDVKDLYEVDLKGDKYNLIYGTIHRYSVPRYYRFGAGRVLGLPSNYRIDRDTAGENEIVVKPETWRTDSSKPKGKSLFSKLDNQPTKLLRVRPTSFVDNADFSKDFLPLKASRSRQPRDDLEASDTEDDKYGYRSIHGKLKHSEDISSGLESMSDLESGGEGPRDDLDMEVKQRSAQLYRHIERNPTDVKAWLQLIGHQELVLRGSAKQSSSLTNAEQKSLADIKLSLYEKALKKSMDQVSHFRQTEFLNFTYSQCLTTFIECLNLNKATSDSPGKTQVQMYLFLRLTLFLRETGYAEHATALWQAIFEFTFFRPNDLDANTSTDQVLSAFADFWDSEVARIGDAGAKGWKNMSTASFHPKVFEPQFNLELKSIMPSWAACERECILNAQLPARSLDEPSDDPYRVILASDLKEFLPLVSSADSKSELIDSFLYFCQLPPFITTHNFKTTGRWMGDGFLRNELVSTSFSALTDWLPNLSTDTDPEVVSPTMFPNQHFIPALETYFTDPKTWFSSFGAWVQATSDPACVVVRDWNRRTLRLLVEAMPQNDDLAEYAVAVEFVCNNKEAKKYAKSLLKKRPSNLRLYNSYALMEWRTGNHAAADHVWATAVSMSNTFSSDDRISNILLWHTWIWELLEARKIAHASHLLASMPQSNVDLKAFHDISSQPEFSPTVLLKIHNHLLETQESAFINGNVDIIRACTDCQAILLYLTHSQDLSKCLEAYNASINRISSFPGSADTFKSYTIELLHQSRARLIYYHLRASKLYKPSYIRTLLAESIALFPHNTIFLSLFSWNESRFRIEERVRDIIRDITTASQHHHHYDDDPSTTPTQIPITTHLFSIYTELNRPVYAGSTLHSARAAFENAIGEQPGTSSPSSSLGSGARSSPSLWKLYILFELSRNEVNRAKDVFYRAMRACPWSKEILMLAFSHLRDDVICRRTGDNPRQGEKGMPFHDLCRLYNVLVEKELRIHLDIERELDDLASQMEQKSLALGMPIAIPDDLDSEDEPMQM